MTFDRREYEDRIARLRAAMTNASVDVMVVDESELLGWITGYMASETMYRAALVPLRGEPWYVVRALDEVVCRGATWFADVIGHPDTDDPVEVIAATLSERGFGTSAIGADFHSYCFTASLRDRFAALLPDARWVNLDRLSGRIRAVKSSAEIGAIARAATIADGTMEQVRAWARPGVTSRQAYAQAAAAFVLRGADNAKVGIVVRGQGDSEFLHGGISDDPLQAGDILHVELVPTYTGYGARLMRPVMIGEPNAVRSNAAERLVALQDRQIEAMVAGADARTVDAVLRDAVLAEGLREVYTNTSGYTLGLYGWTPRVSDFTYNFHPGSNWALEEGMVLHMVTSAQGWDLVKPSLLPLPDPSASPRHHERFSWRDEV